MDSQILTGLVAALGVLASFAGVGQASAADRLEAMTQDDPARHQHRHADFVSNRLHVRVDGEAGPGVRDIVLIPGNASSPAIWQDTVEHLGAGWRVHRIHVQGFAGAPAEGNAEGPVVAPVAEEIARYIAEAGLDSPAVVGHSMGGTVGLMLAARHPDRVGRLMVVDMTAFLGAVHGGPEATPDSVRPLADQIQAGIANSPPEQYRAQTTATVGRMVMTEAARAHPLSDAIKSDQKVVGSAYHDLLVTDLRPELSAIQAPTEVLYITLPMPGMTPEATDTLYRDAFANLSGVQLKRIDDSAHFIMLDQPAAFFAALDAFLSAE